MKRGWYIHLAALEQFGIKTAKSISIIFLNQYLTYHYQILAGIKDTFVGDVNEHDILNSDWQNSKLLFVK